MAAPENEIQLVSSILARFKELFPTIAYRYEFRERSKTHFVRVYPSKDFDMEAFADYAFFCFDVFEGLENDISLHSTELLCPITTPFIFSWTALCEEEDTDCGSGSTTGYDPDFNLAA